ncbi:hypothetical protein LTR22_025868 [Elasticomyces elasticus]|nr:hypothetical protein LTR22_025868 [Elasticomyces elasticus]
MDSTSRDAGQISGHEFPEADKVKPDKDQLALLCLEYISCTSGLAVPWDHIAELFGTFVETEQAVIDEALRQRVSEIYESRVDTGFVVAPKLVRSSRGRMAVEADDSDLDSVDSTVKAARMPFGAFREQTRVSVKVGTCRDLVPSPSYATDMVPASGTTTTTSTTRHVHAYGDGHKSFHDGGGASHFQTDFSNTSNALEAPLQSRMRASATDGVEAVSTLWTTCAVPMGTVDRLSLHVPEVSARMMVGEVARSNNIARRAG